jgi:hypothetical protein
MTGHHDYFQNSTSHIFYPGIIKFLRALADQARLNGKRCNPLMYNRLPKDNATGHYFIGSSMLYTKDFFNETHLDKTDRLSEQQVSPTPSDESDQHAAYQSKMTWWDMGAPTWIPVCL